MSSKENNSNQKGFEINSFGYLKELSKHIWAIILVAIICASLGGIVGKLTSKPTYTSSVSFVVNTLTAGEKAESSAVLAQINMANTFKYILSGRSLKEAVMETCDNKYDYSLINKSITVQVISSTNVVELYVKTNDPVTSYAIAQGVVESYGDIVSEVYPNAKLTLCDRPVEAKSADVNRSAIIIAVVSAFVGVAVYSIVILVMFIVKDTIKSADELANKLDYPVLGSIQNISMKNRANKGLLVVDRKIGFSFIETYKSIRTKIENNSARTGNKVFIVTSACENEGKTTVSVNIALSLAENGKSVLVVDADFRNPSVCKLLGLPETDGTEFTDVIEEKIGLEKALKYVKNFNLFILADQKSVPNPSELLSRKITEDIINSVRNQFDYIIIDTAPASVVTDASVIASFADAAVIVVREDLAPVSRIKMSVEDIDSNGAEIIGFIYNGDTNSGGSNRYGRYGRYGKYGKYGYGYGYGYGHHKSDKK